MSTTIEKRIAAIETTILKVKITVAVVSAMLVGVAGYTWIQIPNKAQQLLNDSSYRSAVADANNAAADAKSAAQRAQAQLSTMPNVVRYGDAIAVTAVDGRSLYIAGPIGKNNAVAARQDLPAGAVNDWKIQPRK